MDLAIVGPAQSGKTTVFNALAGGHGGATAGREHLAAVKIPDERLEKVAALVGAKKTTYAELRLFDLPALFQEGRTASGEAAESLSRADGLVVVVRAFRREDVPHARGEIDPGRDIDDFRAEMVLHDLGIVERRLEKLDTTVRSARPGEREEGQREQEMLLQLKAGLEEGKPAREIVSEETQVKSLLNYGLLTLRPQLVLLNIDEADIPRAAELEAEYAQYVGSGSAVAAMCARLEAELAELDAAEAAEFRRELGAEEPGSARVLARMYEVMGLITFYTAGEETRAWPVRRGTTALEAAGRIHTDIERGFIRAETVAYDDFVALGSEAAARKQGRLRSEGKGYVVQDGDIIHILFTSKP